VETINKNVNFLWIFYMSIVVSRCNARSTDWYFLGKFGSIPLKDHHFGSIPLLSHLHVGPHESMTCGIHGIYLKFGSFNGIDPIVPIFYMLIAYI
jgi:hypothetical protein